MWTFERVEERGLGAAFRFAAYFDMHTGGAMVEVIYPDIDHPDRFEASRFARAMLKHADATSAAR